MITRVPVDQAGGALKLKYHIPREGRVRSHLKTETHSGNIDFFWNDVDILNSGRKENLFLEFTGYIRSPVDGPVSFQVHTDGGDVRLIVDGKTILDKDGIRNSVRYQAGPVTMTSQKPVPFLLYWHKKTLGETLSLSWKYQNASGQLIPWTIIPRTAFTA